MTPLAPSLGTSLLRVALATGMLLLVPLVAMQVTPAVAWTPRDFGAAATLLFGAGAGMVMVSRRVPSRLSRRLLIALIALALATVWVELAVGIFH